MRISDWSSDVCSSELGAEPEVFDRIKEVFDDFTQAALLMGGPGAGMAAKIVRNMMYYATWFAASEAKRLAESAGVDIGKMATINQLSEADASGPTMWLKSWAARDSIPGGARSEEHTSETPVTNANIVCRLLLDKKKTY